MKGQLPYKHSRRFSGSVKLVLFLLVLSFISCNQGAETHDSHQPDSSNSMNKTLQNDSMSGMDDKEMQKMNHQSMNTAGDSSNHPSHDVMPGNFMKSDTDTNENYWNTLPTNSTVIARQKVIEPVMREMDFTVKGTGYITFDMRRNRKVPVRVAGRIERLYVKYNYQYIHKGEKILELYSPELNTYVEEYLYLMRQSTDTLLQSNAKRKLFLLGLTSAQINQMGQTNYASFTIPVYSPFEGYVLFNPSNLSSMGNSENTSGNMGSGMGGATSSSTSIQGTKLTDNSIREGMYVSKDQTLFWVNDFKEAWGIVAFTKENEKYIQKGQQLIINSELIPEKPINTSIQLIEQVYQNGQKFTQARVYIPNASGILKQNSLINAALSLPVKSLIVPASSVYYLGKVAIVWVLVGNTKEGNHIFQSKVVRTGHRSDDKVEILEGLAQNEKIAKDAGYLADGETIIKY